jgi:hypothetical protein
MNIETLVNQIVKVAFVSTNNVTGLTTFADYQLLKNGVSTVFTTTFTELGNGLYTANFTPTTTGLYTLFVQGKIQAIINVVSKTTFTFLQNLEDVSMGSWNWDKNTNVLTFVRQDGTTLATFNVEDDLKTASRERI